MSANSNWRVKVHGEPSIVAVPYVGATLYHFISPNFNLTRFLSLQQGHHWEEHLADKVSADKVSLVSLFWLRLLRDSFCDVKDDIKSFTAD